LLGLGYFVALYNDAEYRLLAQLHKLGDLSALALKTQYLGSAMHP